MGKERSIIKIKKKFSSSNPRENNALKQKDGIWGHQLAVFKSVNCFREIRKQEN